MAITRRKCTRYIQVSIADDYDTIDSPPRYANAIKYWLMVFGVFFLPALVSRLCTIIWNRNELSWTCIGQGLILGECQDLAVAGQCFVFLLCCQKVALSFPANGLIKFISFLLVFSYFVVNTLFIGIDLALQFTSHPRLNLSFITMILENGQQFNTSLQTIRLFWPTFFICVYFMTLVWLAWLFVNGQLPPPQISMKYFRGLSSGWAKITSLFTHVLILFLMFVFACRSGYLLGSNPAQLYYMSNCLFKLEMDSMGISLSPESFLRNAMKVGRSPHANANLMRLLGSNEIFQQASGKHRKKHHFWRKTLGYQGMKSFNLSSSNSSKQPNIVLINMEAWRSLDVGVIGNKKLVEKEGNSVTPQFDALSRDGVLFRQHYTPAVQTSRTILTTLFGLLPLFQPGSAIAQFGSNKKKMQLEGLPHFLKSQGYHTTFFSGTSLTWEHWDIFLKNHAFDETIDSAKIKKIYKGKSTQGTSWGNSDEVSFTALTSYMKKLSKASKAFFIDFYSISSHHPWGLPESYTPPSLGKLTTDKTRAYLNAVRYSDYHLGKFIQSLRDNDLMQNTILIIQGDHGNGRYEHGNNPGIVESRIWEEGSHIPCLLLADGLLKSKGKIIDSLTSQMDIMATIVDMIGVPKEGFYQHGIGHSMMRRESGRELLLQNPFDGYTFGIRAGDLKYTFRGDNSVTVFDLTIDPDEKKPIVHLSDITKASDSIQDKFSFLKKNIKLFDMSYKNNLFIGPKFIGPRLPRLLRKTG